MYRIQWGSVPLVTALLGAVFLTISALLGVGLLVMVTHDYVSHIVSSAAAEFEAVGPMLVLSFFFGYLGAILVSLFPAIRPTKAGLVCRVLFFQGLIVWNEIDRIIQLPNDYVALAINRRGLSFLNGLYFNRLHGLLIHKQEPVLLIAPGLDDHDPILREIATRIRARVMQETDEAFRASRP